MSPRIMKISVSASSREIMASNPVARPETVRGLRGRTRQTILSPHRRRLSMDRAGWPKNLLGSVEAVSHRHSLETHPAAGSLARNRSEKPSRRSCTRPPELSPHTIERQSIKIPPAYKRTTLYQNILGTRRARLTSLRAPPPPCEPASSGHFHRLCRLLDGLPRLAEFFDLG